MASKLQGVFRDSAGNVVASPSVTVYLAGTSTPAAIFSDNALSSALTNPFTGGANGSWECFVAPGQYRITGPGGYDEDHVTAPWPMGESVEGGLVINDLGADADSRFEGDNQPNLFFLDASTDRVGIGTATPAALLHLFGTADLDVRVESTSASATVGARLRNATREWRVFVNGATGELVVRDVTGAANHMVIGTGGRITLGPGSPRFIGRTSAAADPTTTELPADKDFGLHKNTSSGAVFLAYNDAGAIRKVALT